MISWLRSGNFLQNWSLVYREKYGKGEMTTSEVKNILIKVLQELVAEHQVRKL